MNFDQWLATFIEEKGIDTEHVFVIETDENTHLLPVAVVLEAALETTTDEQARIKDMLVRIDIVNASVMDYLEHLAACLVYNFETARS